MKVWAWVLVQCFSLLMVNSLSAQAGMSPELGRIAKAIVESDSDTDAKEIVYQSLLFEFVRQGQLNVIQALDSRGADWRSLEEEGRSLLHVSAANGHLQLVDFFLERGLEIDQLSESKRSALFEATVDGQTELVKLLLDRGADVNGNSPTQQPLTAACWYGRNEIVEMLLAKGADHRRTDSDKNTALHKAVWQGNYECVSLLLKSGADASVANDAGQTPLGMARERASEAVGSDARPWGIEQVLGAPDAGDAYSNLEWAPATDNGAEEWLEVMFGKAVSAKRLEIYAKPTPASIKKVTAFDDEGTEFTLWEGDELKSAKGRSAHIAVLELKPERPINRVKIFLSSAKVSGWVYYDAIGLKDVDGNRHWATWADCSTCYARGPMPKALVHRRILSLIEPAEGR